LLPWTAFFLIAPFTGKHWHTINHTVGGSSSSFRFLFCCCSGITKRLKGRVKQKR
jgi:hypothetical protein